MTGVAGDVFDLAHPLIVPGLISKTEIIRNLLGERESEAVFVMREPWRIAMEDIAKKHKIICTPRSSITVMVTTTAAWELLSTICIIKDRSMAS